MPISKQPKKPVPPVSKVKKRPAMPVEKRNSILSQSGALKKLKIQVSQMKLGLLTLGGKFPELNRNYSKLIILDAEVSSAIYELRDAKQGNKRNEPIEKFEQELVEFQKKIREKKRFIERAVSNKVDSINNHFKELDKLDLSKFTAKELDKLITKAGYASREYSYLKDVFHGNIDFTGPGGIDYAFERQKKFFDKYNKHVQKHYR